MNKIPECSLLLYKFIYTIAQIVILIAHKFFLKLTIYYVYKFCTNFEYYKYKKIVYIICARMYIHEAGSQIQDRLMVNTFFVLFLFFCA